MRPNLIALSNLLHLNHRPEAPTNRAILIHTPDEVLDLVTRDHLAAGQAVDRVAFGTFVEVLR